MSTFDKHLARIITSLKSTYGTDFFNNLTLQLHQLIGADYTFIAKLDKQRNVSKTISLVAKGEVAENFEYSLINTPCAEVNEESTCVYPGKICSLYPNDKLLVDMKIEGYLGSPLLDSHGKVIGLVVALYENNIKNSDFVVALFELFSGRISAEMERSENETKLLELNLNLEKKIQLRTAELTESIQRLRFTQDKLVEQEKMAALGSLVAGVAHEINTPLGVAVLSGSTIQEAVKTLTAKVDNNTLAKSELVSSLDLIKSSEEALSFNLQRAANLVANFKEMAVDINTDELTEISVKSWLDSLIGSLQPMLKKKNIAVVLNTENLVETLTTFPSKVSQVITNVVSNCATHAFAVNAHNANQITIDVKFVEDKLCLAISDNGLGMTDDAQKHMFDPFYTTKRCEGGTGLGLNIVQNIVRTNLKGDLQVETSLGQGTCFTFLLPSLN